MARAPADGSEVHEVAVASAGAGVLLVLPAGGFAEIGDGGELADDWPAGVVAAHQTLGEQAPVKHAPCESFGVLQ